MKGIRENERQHLMHDWCYYWDRHEVRILWLSAALAPPTAAAAAAAATAAAVAVADEVR
jgi:hypothetical protein